MSHKDVVNQPRCQSECTSRPAAEFQSDRESIEAQEEKAQRGKKKGDFENVPITENPESSHETQLNRQRFYSEVKKR